MERKKLYFSLFWLFFSALTCIEASRLDMGGLDEPGPGFFPFAVGLLIGILAVISLMDSFKKVEIRGRAAPQPREPLRWWNILLILCAIIAYSLSLEKVGFLISTFLFMLLLLKVVEPQTWKRAILSGLITAIASELVFNVILGAQIPTGMLGF